LHTLVKKVRNGFLSLIFRKLYIICFTC